MKYKEYQRPLICQFALTTQCGMMQGSNTYEQPTEGELPDDSELQSNHNTGIHTTWDDWDDEE